MKAAGYGDPYIEPTGKALAFGTSVRIRLSNVGQIKKNDTIIGNKCKAVVIKNRMGPPRRTAQFEIHYDSGIQDLKSWLEFMKENSMITGTSAKWTFKLPSGESKLSTTEFVEKVNADAKFKDEVYTMICDKQIMKYRDPNSKIDEDVEISEGSGDEDNEVVDVDKKVKDTE
jgi:recombination protein RecA